MVIFKKKGILAKQFRDLKFGDRFYYENGHDGLTRFSYRQLDEIRKASFARVVCDNTDVNFVQKSPFLKNNFQTNPLIGCQLIDRIDYSAWKDKSY